MSSFKQDFWEGTWRMAPLAPQGCAACATCTSCAIQICSSLPTVTFFIVDSSAVDPLRPIKSQDRSAFPSGVYLKKTVFDLHPSDGAAVAGGAASFRGPPESWRHVSSTLLRPAGRGVPHRADTVPPQGELRWSKNVGMKPLDVGFASP